MFSAEWLALREPADAAARSIGLADAMFSGFKPARVIRVLDLAAGTGANVRFLADRWPRAQDFLCVDVDAGLLSILPGRVSLAARPNVRIETRQLDLAALHDPALFAGRDLVTASALLDLVSDSWLRSLSLRCREAKTAALFALSYDGRIACAPEDPDDETIRDLVNQHQHRDKGFGPALGPEAVAAAERHFAAEGFRVRRERSDWRLSSDMRALQRALLEGWAQAAAEIAPDQAASIDRWRARRLAHLDAGRSAIVVGHEDLMALRN